jgi:hypothetical protein
MKRVMILVALLAAGSLPLVIAAYQQPAAGGTQQMTTCLC